MDFERKARVLPQDTVVKAEILGDTSYISGLKYKIVNKIK